MVLTTPERRSLARFPLRLPVKIQILETGGQIFAETKDISAGGMYLYADLQLDIGSSLAIRLTIPEHLAQSATAIEIACEAKVLRLNRDQLDGRTGVAVEISSYDFLTQAARV